ncbi:MAG: aspartate aminotransferase family protein [Bacillati bacterium ANGP1]|uniref:glutamate-1-semialdehyde 2,1-aminomutase n=1 Tax=Candidatus Segetimicrobium genomatis TaxID=2569760 RepID=A0A537LFP8_9BACT|nr:MAG: aspartate aminotransferase family protein [Terrabacteria group bacterium ANGP1]
MIERELAGRLHYGRQLWDRARRVLPGGVNSNVKMDERPQPLYFVRAEGSRLVDCDGNSYIDFTCGYGPVILGHGYPSVVHAVHQATARGMLFGGQHEAEVQLAELLRDLVPCIDMVRLNCTGSEAVAAAVRLARAYTGRTKVVRFAGHYHGWFDELLVSTHPPADHEESVPLLESAGQPASAIAEVLVTRWNDLSSLERLVAAHPGKIAAVLMEPIMCNTGVIFPDAGYLQGVRDLCRAQGIVLVFDEVITGFRVHLGGAQALLNVVPDLAVFGKAMANGFPVSCVGGRREILEPVASAGVVHAGTFNGNPLGVAAALATLHELSLRTNEIYPHLMALGTRLMKEIRKIAVGKGIPVLLQGPGPVFYMWFTDVPAVSDYRSSARIDRAPYARFAEALLAAGVRVIPGGRWYVSFSHTDADVNRTLEAVSGALDAAAR